jgi:hypothetical protein
MAGGSGEDIKRPKQTRDSEEEAAVCYMHALADTAAGAEDEVVAFCGVGVSCGFSGREGVVGVAGGVEDVGI